MRRRSLALLPLLVLPPLVALGCVVQDGLFVDRSAPRADGAAGPPECKPGAAQICAFPEGAMVGIQHCNEAGHWGPCRYEPATSDAGAPADRPAADLRVDAARLDRARPDFGRPDFGRPDRARPDLARPDLARPDRARPDRGPADGPPTDSASPPPLKLDNDIVLVEFDHATGSIRRLIYKQGSNQNILDSDWIAVHAQGLGRISGETGTTVKEFRVGLGDAVFVYNNPFYGEKRIELRWGVDPLGLEIDIRVENVPAGVAATEGSTWRPGGDNDPRDLAEVLLPGGQPMRFQYTYPGQYRVLFQGESMGVGLWDSRYDEAFGYKFDAPSSITLAESTSAEGPHIALPPGTRILHFAVKSTKRFLDWLVA